MPVIRRIGRELLAPMFVTGGLDSLRNPQPKAAKAATVTTPLADAFGLPDDPVITGKVSSSGRRQRRRLGLEPENANRLLLSALEGAARLRRI